MLRDRQRVIVGDIDKRPRRHSARFNRATRTLPIEACLVGLTCVTFAAYWAVCAVLIHRSFHSNGWDLGLINQVIWNTSNGRLFEYSFRVIPYSGDHWQPFLLIFVPLKWISTGPEALLIAQATLLALAAVPLYAMVRSKGAWQDATAVAVAYLLSLATAQAVSYDFHIETAAPLFAFMALLGLERERLWWFVASSALILTLKEDGALLVLALAWIAWLAYGKVKLAAASGAAAVIYATVVVAVVIPHYRGDDLNPFAERYGYLGDTPLSAFWGMLRHPNLVASQLAGWDTFEAVLIVLAGVAFLPLVAPRLVPPLALVTVLPLLSREQAQSSLDAHYLLVPTTVALLTSAIVVRDRSWRALVATSKRAWSPLARSGPSYYRAALLAIPLFMLVVGSPLPPSWAADFDRFRVDRHASVSRSFIDDIPSDAVVSAQSPFVPHLSERRHIYQFPRVLNAEFVLVDRAGPIPSGDLAAGYYDCLEALPRLGFEKSREEDGVTLWRKTGPAERVPDVPTACSGQH